MNFSFLITEGVLHEFSRMCIKLISNARRFKDGLCLDARSTSNATEQHLQLNVPDGSACWTVNWRLLALPELAKRAKMLPRPRLFNAELALGRRAAWPEG